MKFCVKNNAERGGRRVLLLCFIVVVYDSPVDSFLHYLQLMLNIRFECYICCVVGHHTLYLLSPCSPV